MNPVKNTLSKTTTSPFTEHLSVEKADKAGVSNRPEKILYFGIYDPKFIRNKVIMLGFERNGYEVFECRVDPREISGTKKYVALYKKSKQFNARDFSYIIVGFPGAAPVVLLARLLFGRKIIFDAFLSQFDANVSDRKEHTALSPKGIRDWLYDWLSCTIAWRVLLPEMVHIKFFVDKFGINSNKFIRIFTGANDEIFHPLTDVKKADVFTVHFHGNFIPLQGVEYIIEAANILRDEDIRFQIVGAGGSLFESIKKKVANLNLKNVDMLGRKPLEEVPHYITRAHISLGVFGTSDKAKRVISNKVYEYVATGAPVITARTPAMQEVFTDKENILFCNSSDGKDMAEKILMLKEDKELRDRIAEGGYKTFTERLSPDKLVEQLLLDLASVK